MDTDRSMGRQAEPAGDGFADHAAIDPAPLDPAQHLPAAEERPASAARSLARRLVDTPAGQALVAAQAVYLDAYRTASTDEALARGVAHPTGGRAWGRWTRHQSVRYQRRLTVGLARAQASGATGVERVTGRPTRRQFYGRPSYLGGSRYLHPAWVGWVPTITARRGCRWLTSGRPWGRVRYLDSVDARPSADRI